MLLQAWLTITPRMDGGGASADRKEKTKSTAETDRYVESAVLFIVKTGIRPEERTLEGKSHQIQNQCEQNKRQREPLGRLCELGIKCFSLAF